MWIFNEYLSDFDVGVYFCFEMWEYFRRFSYRVRYFMFRSLDFNFQFFGLLNSWWCGEVGREW